MNSSKEPVKQPVITIAKNCQDTVQQLINEWEQKRDKCPGCKYDLGNQEAHIGVDGCLGEE